MNNIYVDESKIKLYVSKEAPISQDCLYADETKLVSWFEETECELEHEDCQLLLLEDRLAEERKKVVQILKDKIEKRNNGTRNGNYSEQYKDGYSGCCCDVVEFLDQLEEVSNARTNK